jgi:hypothetical protein
LSDRAGTILGKAKAKHARHNSGARGGGEKVRALLRVGQKDHEYFLRTVSNRLLGSEVIHRSSDGSHVIGSGPRREAREESLVTGGVVRGETDRRRLIGLAANASRKPERGRNTRELGGIVDDVLLGDGELRRTFERLSHRWRDIENKNDAQPGSRRLREELANPEDDPDRHADETKPGGDG